MNDERSAAKGGWRQKGNGGQPAGVARGIGGSRMVARYGLGRGKRRTAGGRGSPARRAVRR